MAANESLVTESLGLEGTSVPLLVQPLLEQGHPDQAWLLNERADVVFWISLTLGLFRIHKCVNLLAFLTLSKNAVVF